MVSQLPRRAADLAMIAVFLPLYASMKVIDGDYLKAAANLGASPPAAFWRVFFPLSLPGPFAGLLLVFVISLGFFVTPVVLGGVFFLVDPPAPQNNPKAPPSQNHTPVDLPAKTQRVLEASKSSRGNPKSQLFKRLP